MSEQEDQEDFEIDEVLEALDAASEANQDVLNSHSLEFIKRWQSVKIEVPANLLAFADIYDIVKADNREALGQWYQPVQDPDAIRDMLGPEIAAVFIDYVRVNRYAYILQQLNLHTQLKSIELGMDEDGNVKYILGSHAVGEELRGSLELLIEAHDKHFR